MPPKLDLVFNTTPNTVETNHPTFNVKLSLTKPDQDMSHTHRPSAPLIKDWVSDSEDESETKTPQNIPSFVQPTEQVIRPRQHKPIITKPNSPTIRHINRSSSPKASNSPPRVTAVKALVVNVAKGNMSYLYNFEDLNGGYVTFGGNLKVGKISRKEFKLPDENQVLLRVPRGNNMYNVNLKNIVSSRDLTCLFAKSILDESNLWNRRLGHINFKTMNKLVKGNLVKGLPTKVFENDKTCVACKKGKQHRASYKTKLNRVLVTKPHNKTSYELLHGRTPSIGFMRPFGCPVTILNTLDSLGKFDGKADEGFLVRYYVSSKAFRVFNSRTQIIQETLHVNFLENKHNVAGEEIVQQYVFFLVWSSGSTNPQNTYGDAAFDEKELEFDEKKPESKLNVSLSSSAQSKKHDNKTKKEAKVLAVGQISPNSTNTFSDAGPLNADDSSTHGKSSCIDTSQLPDDADMLELEDITYSDDEDDVGAEANFNNLETSITVSPIPTIRVHKDHPVTQIIGDLSSATQTRSMTMVAKDQGGLSHINNEDFHTCMFACFLSQEEPKREEGIDYEEVFAPVAKKEAIRLLLAYASFMGFMVYLMDVKSAFLYGIIEEEVYVCQPLGFENPDYPDKKKDGIFISQDKYVAEILRKFGLTDGKLASTPIDTKKPLMKDPDGEDVDVHTYISMIGSLMYLTSSRSDIMFAVCACARFQVTPKASHLHAVKRIFRYLKGKPHLGLWYPKDLPFDLVACSDSDYAGASLDRKSTTEGCQFLGCRLISWQCKKQIVVATSYTKAEYVATTRVNTPRCDEDRLDIIELMVFLSPSDEKVRVEKVNDVTRLQALVDKKKMVITKASIRYALCLDDPKRVECLPNEEIFIKLARIGYEKPSIKLTFYKAFFSIQWKFLIHTILQCMSAKRTSWNEFSSSMASAVICLSSGKRFFGIETPLFEGMIVEQHVVKGDDEVYVEVVNAVGVAVEWVVSAVVDVVPTADDEPSIPSPTPPTPPPEPSQDIP
uniref:Uncharacterized mitochondrial protein AtMg00810-like n=1 Tax=Tanacetum cinerariifolium TaxID=118510 RepID=A0A6L2MIH9_TANCI|nr:uncharacterized mitochondrial protein AtMg00810-like [Tanacetum cinerariifolium]